MMARLSLARLSLHARLVLIALVTGAAALLFAAFAIGDVLEGVVRRNLGEKLDGQAMMLARAVDPAGQFHSDRAVILPGFERERGGWGWHIKTSAGTWQGGTPIRDIQMRDHHDRHEAHEAHEMREHGGGDDDGPRIRPDWGRGRTPDGQPIVLQRRTLPHPAGPLVITTVGPRDIIERPLHAAMMPLLASLGLLALGLALAALVQLRFGLKPVRALRDAVARVRMGDLERLPEDGPQELRPLAAEVNALIDQNEAGLDNARSHVANLAHGLKTPLATLALRLDREGASAESRALVAQLDKRIAHHLRRARMAAAGSGDRARTDLAPVAEELVLAMTHIHASRDLIIHQAVAGPAEISVERQDIEEMVGNLLDNACRHARSRVTLEAAPDGTMMMIRIEDDGPGIAEADLPRALDPGTRLDESGAGYGFGLGIVQELAELYGGGLALDRSPALSGLRATLMLPRRR